MADRLSPITGRSTSAKRHSRLVAGLLTLALVAAGCGDGGGDGEVDITYRQIAFFPSYEVNPGSPSTPGENGAFILYRITEVDNQSGADFVLDPNRLISQHDQETKEHAAHEVQLLGDQQVEPTEVEAGESASDLGCVVMVVRVDNFEETFGNFGGTVTSVDLEYQEPASGTATMTREEGNTGFTILNGAAPESVQQACQGGD